MEIFQEEEEKEFRWTRVLLIVNLIIWTFILFLFFVFDGIVHAQTGTMYNTNSIYLRDTSNNYHRYDNTSRQTVGYNTNLINYQWTTYQGGVVDSTVVLRIYNYNRPTKPTLTINVTENGASVPYFNSSYSCGLQWNSTQLIGQLECNIHVMTTLQGGNYWEIQVTPNNILPFIDFQAYGSAFITPNDGATSTDIQNQTITIINNENANTDRVIDRLYQDHQEQLEKLSAVYTAIQPDTVDFDNYESIESDLHSYTNVDLQDFEVDLDTDTNGWVWSTVTRLLNVNNLVFGMFISILSIGLIKLVLNR